MQSGPGGLHLGSSGPGGGAKLQVRLRPPALSPIPDSPAAFPPVGHEIRSSRPPGFRQISSFCRWLDP